MTLADTPAANTVAMDMPTTGTSVASTLMPLSKLLTTGVAQTTPVPNTNTFPINLGLVGMISAILFLLHFTHNALCIYRLCPTRFPCAMYGTSRKDYDFCLVKIYVIAMNTIARNINSFIF